MRWALVLAGGVGSRFWPLSAPDRPKQLLPLAGPLPLLLDAVERIVPLVPAERVVVVTSRSLEAAVREVLSSAPGVTVLAEPRPASTGPALAWATAHAAERDREASVLSLHADWTVGRPDAFRDAARTALETAEDCDSLVSVGAVPTRPETGYGYVVPGEPLSGPAKRIRRFVEKPDAAAAERLLAEGALWNTGLFAWTARRFRKELETHTPEMAPAMRALDEGDVERFFSSVTPVSVDVGLFERTGRGAVVPGDFDWDDVGSWAALRRVRATDGSGNVLVGPVHARDVSDSVIWSEDAPVVVDGLSNVVVVRARGVTLVTTAERAPNLKQLLDRLPADLAGERGA